MQSNAHKKNRGPELWEFNSNKQKISNGRTKTGKSARTGRTSVDELRTIDITTSPKRRNADMEYLRKRRQARRRKAYLYRALAVMMLISVAVLFCTAVGLVYRFFIKEERADSVAAVSDEIINDAEENAISKPEIAVDLLNINEYSRPGDKIDEIKSIFVHYTANPGTSAAQNRSYFANLEETHERSASAHFIIGYEGEIIQCIPLDEQAYAVMTRNNDSISIECCYLDEDGQFTQETYDSLVHLLAWLKQEYELDSEDILRHYDCGGKLCPLYYVENEDAWEKLLRDVDSYED